METSSNTSHIELHPHLVHIFFSKFEQTVMYRTMLHRLHTTSIRAHPGEDDLTIGVLLRKKRELQLLIQQQRVKRLSKQEAFLTWQAGQREKGAGLRLTRKHHCQEKRKTAVVVAQHDRLLPVSYHTPTGENSNTWISDDVVDVFNSKPKEFKLFTDRGLQQ